MKYQPVYSDQAKASVRMLSADERARVVDAVRQQLTQQAEDEVTNRKRMRPNKLGIQWELRLGNLRIFYNVTGSTVEILFIGTKKGNKVFVGSEEIEL